MVLVDAGRDEVGSLGARSHRNERFGDLLAPLSDAEKRKSPGSDAGNWFRIDIDAAQVRQEGALK